MDIGTTMTVVGTGLGVGGVSLALIRAVLRLNRRLDQLREDWEGQPARNGFDEVPGVPKRLHVVEDAIDEIKTAVQEATKQLLPNGGASARDAINRVELNLSRVAMDQTIQARLLTEHLQQSAPMYAELLEMRRELTELHRPQPPEGEEC